MKCNELFFVEKKNVYKDEQKQPHLTSQVLLCLCGDNVFFAAQTHPARNGGKLSIIFRIPDVVWKKLGILLVHQHGQDKLRAFALMICSTTSKRKHM